MDEATASVLASGPGPAGWGQFLRSAPKRALLGGGLVALLAGVGVGTLIAGSDLGTRGLLAVALLGVLGSSLGYALSASTAFKLRAREHRRIQMWLQADDDFVRSHAAAAATETLDRDLTDMLARFEAQAPATAREDAWRRHLAVVLYLHAWEELRKASLEEAEAPGAERSSRSAPP